jgi:hypothetical protein
MLLTNWSQNWNGSIQELAGVENAVAVMKSPVPVYPLVPATG